MRHCIAPISPAATLIRASVTAKAAMAAVMKRMARVFAKAVLRAGMRRAYQVAAGFGTGVFLSTETCRGGMDGGAIAMLAFVVCTPPTPI